LFYINFYFEQLLLQYEASALIFDRDRLVWLAAANVETAEDLVELQPQALDAHYKALERYDKAVAENDDRGAAAARHFRYREDGDHHGRMAEDKGSYPYI
jgi:hypothetical protein